MRRPDGRAGAAARATAAAAVLAAALAGGCGRAPSILVTVEVGGALAADAAAVTAVRVDVTGTPEDAVTITLPAAGAFDDGASSFLYRPAAAEGALAFAVTLFAGPDALGTGASAPVAIPAHGRAEVTVTIGAGASDGGSDAGSDASPGDAAGPACVDGADDYCAGRTLVACAGGAWQAPAPCDQLCVAPDGAGTAARCAAFVPAVSAVGASIGLALADPGLYSIGLATLTIVGPLELNTTTGEIRFAGSTIRAAGAGLVAGVWFANVAQSGSAQSIGVFVLAGLVTGPYVTIVATGPSALAIVATGEIRIEGAVDLAAPSIAAAGGGAGGFAGGPALQAGSGPLGCGGGSGLATGSTGAGGGGLGAPGGAGGDNLFGAVAVAGALAGSDDQALLLGGCGGGGGAGGGAGGGGGGGGALYLGALGGVFLGPGTTIDVSGNGGTQGFGSTAGAGGGGAGGAVLLEGPTVDLGPNVRIVAEGGGGGGGRSGTAGADPSPVLAPAAAAGGTGGGGANGGAGGAGASPAGADGAIAGMADGSGGGGGAAGRIRINTLAGAATIDATAVLSPAPTFGVLGSL